MKIVATFVIALLAASPVLAQDAGNGEKIFKKCKACHAVGPGAKNRVGPVLTGVVGRQAGSYEGFRYGKSMKAAGAAGLVWTAETLFDYLANPKTFLRTTLDDPKARAKMTFRLKDEQARHDVIAYLATFSTAAATPAATGDAAMAQATDRPGKVCVVNASEEAHYFAAQVGDGTRATDELAPGGELCADAAGSKKTGVISVYEKPDAFEGCSRIVDVGKSDTMVKYVDFDRCFWGSNS